MRPWWLAIGGAALLVVGERLAASWANIGGPGLDRVLDLSLLTFLSITMVWAPMWTMRIIRRTWQRLDRIARLACAWQVLLQGFVVAPALWLGVSWLTSDVQGGRILAVSAAGSALMSLGGAVSLVLRAR